MHWIYTTIFIVFIGSSIYYVTEVKNIPFECIRGIIGGDDTCKQALREKRLKEKYGKENEENLSVGQN